MRLGHTQSKNDHLVTIVERSFTITPHPPFFSIFANQTNLALQLKKILTNIIAEAKVRRAIWRTGDRLKKKEKKTNLARRIAEASVVKAFARLIIGHAIVNIIKPFRFVTGEEAKCVKVHKTSELI